MALLPRGRYLERLDSLRSLSDEEYGNIRDSLISDFDEREGFLRQYGEIPEGVEEPYEWTEKVTDSGETQAEYEARIAQLQAENDEILLRHTEAVQKLTGLQNDYNILLNDTKTEDNSTTVDENPDIDEGDVIVAPSISDLIKKVE